MGALAQAGRGIRVEEAGDAEDTPLREVVVVGRAEHRAASVHHAASGSAQAVTSTPRQKATWSLISVAFSLGVG